MTTSLADLTAPLSREDVEDAIYAAIAARGLSTTTWKPGAVVRTLIAAIALVLASLSALIALIAQSGFLALASGDWLTLVARYVYNVERITGTFATGNVTLTNTGVGVYNVAIGDLVLRHATSGKTYRNTAAFALGASPATVSVAMQADEIGTPSNANAATITGFVTPLLGVTASNPAALLGTDAESDVALRSRCSDKLGSLSPNGPSDAYSSVAKAAKRADGSAIGINRVKTVATGSGGVTVYVTDADGTVAGGDLTTVDTEIQTKAVPLGITATVVAATTLSIPVTYEVWVRNNTGLDATSIRGVVSEMLQALFAGTPIGGFIVTPPNGLLHKSQIEGAIAAAFHTASVPGGSAVDGALVKLSVTAPAGDTALTAGQVPVLGLITGTVNQVVG